MTKYNLKDTYIMQYNSVKTVIFKYFKMSNIDRISAKTNLNPLYHFPQNNYTP